MKPKYISLDTIFSILSKEIEFCVFVRQTEFDNDSTVEGLDRVKMMFYEFAMRRFLDGDSALKYLLKIPKDEYFAAYYIYGRFEVDNT